VFFRDFPLQTLALETLGKTWKSLLRACFLIVAGMLWLFFSYVSVVADVAEAVHNCCG
jgi:hypothetical protein